MNAQTHRDQRYRDQPTLFGSTPDTLVPAVPVSQSQARGRESRNDQHAAIESEMPDRRRFILALIRGSAGVGVTLDEIAAATGKPANAFSGRVTELVASGHVIRTAMTRPTRFGGTAKVVVASEFYQSIFSRPSQPCKPKDAPAMTTLSKTNEQPDGLTRTTTPRDKFGEPMAAGLQYRVGKTRVLCFDAEDGELYLQPCHAIGTLVPDTRPQHVLTMPAGALQITRIDPMTDEGDAS